MPYSVNVLPEFELVLSRAWGRITRADVDAHQAEVLEHPSFDPQMRQFADLRAVEFDVSGFDIQDLATRSVFSADSKRAVVVSSDVLYGLTRMWGALSEGRTGNVRPFTDVDEACAWLEISTTTVG
jgi:hypothetical protein